MDSCYLQLNERIVNRILDNIFSELDLPGSCDRPAIKLYTSGGSARGTLLSTCYFDIPAFSKAVNGMVKSYKITPDTNASATGTAAHFELVDRNNCVVISGSVGLKGSNHPVQLDKLTITAGDYVIIESLEFSFLTSIN